MMKFTKEQIDKARETKKVWGPELEEWIGVVSAKDLQSFLKETINVK